MWIRMSEVTKFYPPTQKTTGSARV